MKRKKEKKNRDLKFSAGLEFEKQNKNKIQAKLKIARPKFQVFPYGIHCYLCCISLAFVTCQ